MDDRIVNGDAIEESSKNQEALLVEVRRVILHHLSEYIAILADEAE